MKMYEFDASPGFLAHVAQKIRRELGIETVDVTHLCTASCRAELDSVAEQRKLVTEKLREMQIISPENRYDLEYSNASELSKITGQFSQFSGTHYWHWSPILDRGVLGHCIPSRDTSFGIGEAGCGNGTLLAQIKLLNRLSVPLHGIDISKKAVERIEKMGIFGFCGRIQDRVWSMPFSKIIHSYFVDRDSDQRETFKATGGLLCHGGHLVLEGLFPCRMVDSGGIIHGEANITKGADPVEDIELVRSECAIWDMTLEKVFVGQRLVYSMDGKEVLPTYILIFRKRNCPLHY